MLHKRERELICIVLALIKGNKRLNNSKRNIIIQLKVRLDHRKILSKFLVV
jgi:hypothetical protein